MNKLMKRVLTSIASVALAVTGLTAGAVTASAASPSDVDDSETLTFTATDEQQLTNASLKAYKIASYVHYSNGTEGGDHYGLKTVSGANSAITDFLTDHGYTVPDSVDPLAWAQSQTPAIFGSETSGTSTSNERKLATKLAPLAKNHGTELTLTGSGTTRTASVPAGLYVIVDDSTTNPSVPMIVGTAPVGDGKINMKNAATPSITKTIDGTRSASADIGETKTVTLTTKMPNTANHDSYTWHIYDLVDPGMTVDISSIQVAGKYAGSGSNARFTVQLATRTGDSVSPADTSAASGEFVGTKTQALVITLDKAQLAALGVDAGHDITITYHAKLNDSVKQNDSTGAVLASGASSAVHAAKNTAIVSDNGAESPANASDAQSLLSTSDFMFSKVWANGAAASGAKFTVKNSDGKYLQAYTADSGWTWGATPYEFEATTSPNEYSFSGLGDGTYTVSESTVATGAFDDMKPSFTVTINHGYATPVTATSNDVWGLVATSGSAVPRGAIAVVTNVHNITELPKTGAAGIILVVAVIVLLFAGAFLLISLYRRKAIANR